MSEQHANKLEAWFSGLPSLVQEVLHEPFTWMNNGLKQVSGDPQALLAAAPQYIEIADTVSRLGVQQRGDRNALAARWTGDAFDAFSAQMDHINDQFNQLAHAIKQVKGLLENGAKACVDGANMIIDLVTSLIMFALSLIAVNVALSIITLGTSLAASVAAVIAKAVQVIAKVARVIEKVAEVLTKLASMFTKLKEILRTVTGLLKELEAYLKAEKTAAKAAKGMDWARKTAVFNAKNAAVSQGIKYGTGGVVAPPGTAGSAYHGAGDYGDGWSHASDAQDAVR